MRWLAAALLAAAGPAQGASDWSAMNVPDPPAERTSNQVNDIACITASDCWAVGHYFDARVHQTLVEHWNGSDWSIVPSPNRKAAADGGPMNNYLHSVACTSASDCWAVGYAFAESGYQTLIEHWNGSAWSIVPSPNPGTAWSVLRAVACATPTQCWAVGYATGGGVDRTLIARWDGVSWSLAASPNVGAASNSLWGVACAGAQHCWAVGNYDNGVGVIQALTVRWDGSAWTAGQANPLPTQSNYLLGVSCNAAADCWAVGYYYGGAGAAQTLVEHWDGSAWTLVPSPNSLPTQHNYLVDVACAAPSDCWAAGYYLEDRLPTPRGQTELLHWDGSSWSAAASPNTPGEDNALLSVACAGSACRSVGYHVTQAAEQTLVLQLDAAAWSIVDSPNQGAIRDNYLYGISCVSAADCWAVGYYSNPAYPAKSLAAHWDGEAWRLVDTPNAGERNTFLLGVHCVATDDCWAVGYSFFTGGSPQTFIARWDGSAWNQVASPNTGASERNHLYGVTCASATECWAVGYSRGSDVTGAAVDETLVARWDGSAWSIVPSPNVLTAPGNYLYGVDCAAAAECWAVGATFANNAYQALALRWNGLLWARVEAPSTGAAQNNVLRAVDCASASSCFAVGSFHNGAAEQTLIERWDGASWSLVPSANTGSTAKNILYGVTCNSASDCWAVGSGHTPYTDKALIQHWDGSAWTLSVAAPVLKSEYGFLYGVDCVTPEDCWTVGFSGFGNTMAQHYPPIAPPNRPPIPALAGAPASGAAPLDVVFDAGGSLDPDEGDAIVLYAYDFGDGAGEARGDALPVTHRYDSAGTFTATLTVTDRSGTPSVEAAAVTITVTAPVDDVPDAFAFAGRIGVATNVYVTSESRTIAGFTGALPITIDNGGQYRINGGAWTSAAGQIASGSTLAVRHVSAASESTTKASRVTVGTYFTDFRTTTAATDRVPNAFTFGTKTGVAPGEPVASEITAIEGFNVPVSIVPGPGASYRIDGAGAFTTASGTLNPGQRLQVQHTASSTALAYTKTYVKVGGVTGYFTTRTR